MIPLLPASILGEIDPKLWIFFGDGPCHLFFLVAINLLSSIQKDDKIYFALVNIIYFLDVSDVQIIWVPFSYSAGVFAKLCVYYNKWVT